MELGRTAKTGLRPPSSAAASSDSEAGWRTDSGNPQLRFHIAVFSTLGLCAVLYTMTGAFGYLACGSATQGDVLLNFPVADPAAAVARALMAVHVVLAFPVVVLPCRKAIFMLAFFVAAAARRRGGRCARLCGGSSSGSGAAGPRRDSNDMGSGSSDANSTSTSAPSVAVLPVTTGAGMGGTDPHADVLQAYRQLEHDTNLVCGMGCTLRHVFWNFILVGGPAIVAVGVPQVQVRNFPSPGSPPVLLRVRFRLAVPA